MQNLSIYTFSNIIKFLQVEEIYSKLTISKLLIQQLYHPHVQKVILSNYFPSKIVQQIDPQKYIQCIKSLKGCKIKEIPFWGIETNGGLSNNSLRFWIGKTFMKTNQPQVGIRKLENSFLSGTLAFNQISFKKALLEYAKNFIDFMGQEITYHFFPDWDEIEDNQIDMSKIRIFDIFRSFQIFSYYYDEQDWNCLKYLRDYAYVKHEQIDQMLEIDPYNLKDQDHQIIPQGISLVQEISINRRTQMTQIIKSILIFTSIQQYIPNYPDEIYNCQTPEKLYYYILQHPQFMPSQTNISLLKNMNPNIIYEDEHQLDYWYCTFIPIDDKQPLIWAQFVNPNFDEINLKFDKQTQRLAKSIQVRILDACYQENPYFNGIGIAYVSCKGLTLNEVNWTIIKELPD
ncbi:unnamed protein product [Paramecium primaurelia]|uniref:Uncharacterized protein n=1 Tax=Paramecium primaurelia TaxID=5886 RepID=A0A8S1PJ34_PARPR|nr:unnamed protein product [Paramecium primaurelia]